ncbi:hypothetical protein C0J52_03196 [Blattella germanica]|nr:hypothetical protein C0J52_03196 [Blattella germanica]
MGKAEQHFEERTEHSEASKMLEAALQQMDGIISGARLELPDGAGGLSLGEAVQQLVAVLQQSPELPPPPALPPDSRLLQWLQQQEEEKMRETTTTSSECGGGVVAAAVAILERQITPPPATPRKGQKPSELQRSSSANSKRPPPETTRRPDASLGGDESSPDDEEEDDEEEDSTLKCSGGGWSGSDTATHRRSSSTSDFSGSSSEEDVDVPPRLSEDLNTTGCDEDFQWVHGTGSDDTTKVNNKRRRHEMALNYDPPQIMEEAPSNGCQQLGSENSGVVHRKPPRHDSNPTDKASSLDRRRYRDRRDQKAKSSIILRSPRYLSPSRRGASPAALDRRQYEPCCIDEAKFLPCRNSTTNVLRCSSSHECMHRPTHCCSSSSLCNDVMSTSYDSSFLDGCHHHRHHHGDLQRYGSAGHLKMCHGSQQDLLAECCFGSHGHLPLCNCQAERHCSKWRTNCKQSSGNTDVEERLHRLEADKDSLQLQVAVLTEQIEVQTDKILDLEKLLDEKKRQLANAEDELQREMLSRSSLETQKLELLSAMSEMKLQQAALERDNLELRDRLGEERRRNKPPAMPRTLLATSTPVASQLLGAVSPSPSPVSSLSEGSPRRLGNHPNSVEDFKDIPAPRRATTNGTAVSPMEGVSPPANAPGGIRKGVAFGKGLVSSFLPFQHPQRSKVSGPDKSFSTPNLAETERVVIEDATSSPLAEEEVDATTESSPSFQAGKSKGIKKIFGRMKRSGSGNLDDLPGEGDFRRGGVRATAGPRLGWTNQPLTKQHKSDLPFNDWDSDAICRWLQELGLDCYAGDAKRWVKSGSQLLQASNHELEKELGIKNPLHRKKLHLALLSRQENAASLDPHLVPAGELDTAWVLRWLDDAGLPQYKETFLAARVDGRVLHRLTMDDLAMLHVTSHLHVASLRRGIQVLRDHKLEPDCLKRRSLPDDPAQPTARDVALWTNHRVMEWLRVVDLAEYAPNLRGSGVHGGLMVHEPRFTAELLASLLSIPPSKTLLRRHLNTHFKELLGRECIQEKREAEATLGYIPLSATTKIKIIKKSQFTLKRKKSKSELDFGDLVCPLDPKSGETQPPGDGMKRTTTTTEALPPRVVAVCLEVENKDHRPPERTSNV